MESSDINNLDIESGEETFFESFKTKVGDPRSSYSKSSLLSIIRDSLYSFSSEYIVANSQIEFKLGNFIEEVYSLPRDAKIVFISYSLDKKMFLNLIEGVGRADFFESDNSLHLASSHIDNFGAISIGDSNLKNLMIEDVNKLRVECRNDHYMTKDTPIIIDASFGRRSINDIKLLKTPERSMSFILLINYVG